MQQSKQIKDSKAYNIYDGQIVRNWIPLFIEFYKLDTHTDLTLFNGTNKKYITNILVAGVNNIKLFALFQDQYVQQLCQTKVLDNIRSINKWQKTILVQTDKKIFGLLYEEGVFRTVYMFSLDFLNLSGEYKSFIKVDYYARFCIIVVNQYMIVAMNNKLEKETSAKFIFNTFEKIDEETQWSHVGYQLFQNSFLLKLSDLNIKDLYDVEIDHSKIYFLVYQPPDSAVYVIKFQRNFSKRESIIQRRFQFLPPSSKLITLSPETQSNLVVLSNQKLIFIDINIQQYSISVKDRFQVKVRPCLPNMFYLSDHEGIYSYLIGENQKNEPILIQQIIIRDFKIHYATQTLLYLSNGKCILKKGSKQKILYRYLNSIIDFHIIHANKSILAIEKGEASNEQKNKLILIKRNFKISDKTYPNPKKTIFQRIANIENIKNLPNHNLIAIYTDNNIQLFQDKQTLIKYEISESQRITWIDEIAINNVNYLIYLSLKNIIIESKETKRVLDLIMPDYKKIYLMNENIILVNSKKIQFINILNELNYSIELQQFQTNFIDYILTTKDNYFKQVPKLIKSNSSTNISNIPIPSGNIRCYLLYVCYKAHLEIYQIDTNIKISILKSRFLYINEGPAYLHNHHLEPKQTDTYLRSITDPQYISHHHYQITKEEIINFIVAQTHPNNKILIFETNKFEFYVYKIIMSTNDLGFVYRRIILPLYINKFPQGPIRQYTHQLLRFGNRIFYGDTILEINEPFNLCFTMGQDIWITTNQNKLKLMDLKGQRISGKIVKILGENKSYIGIQSSPQNFCVYTREVSQIYDKEINFKAKLPIQAQESSLTVKQQIITLKMSHSYLGVSSYQHYRHKSNVQEFQSIKFLFTLFEIPSKMRFQPLKFQQEAIVSLRFIQNTRLILVTSSCINICEIKVNKVEIFKAIPHSQRYLASSVGFWIKPKICLLLVGSAFGGLSFLSFDDQKLFFQQKRFEGLRCGIRQIEIFGYGKTLKGFLADEDKNIIIVDLKQNEIEKLADFNIGTRATKIIRHQDTFKTIDTHTIYSSFANGSIHVFVPIKLQDQDNSLLRFQTVLSQSIPFLGGLNERQYRRLKQTNRSYKLGGRGNFLQCQMLQIFLSLSKILQRFILQKSNFQQDEIKLILQKYCTF